MKHFSYLSMVFILLAGLMCCVTETNPSGSSSSSVKPKKKTAVYSISEVEFDSLSYILTAETDASDDKEITMTVNNQSVTAKANKGRLSADLSKCWTNADKGGKQYEVTFSAVNASVNPSKVNIDYWPKAVCELKSASVVTIYNGSSNAYQSPQFTLNYETGSYDYTMSFIVKDALDNDITRRVPGIATWKLSQMLTYLMMSDHIDYSVKVTATVTPKRNGIPQPDLQCQVSVTYISCKDVLASKVKIEHYYNYYIAVTYDENDNPAGGNIKYEWQVSDNQKKWLSMMDTECVIEITKDKLGKYLRCTITQTFEGETKAPITSEAVKLNNLISEAYLYYDDIVPYGSNPIANLVVGTAVNVFGADVKNLTFSFEDLSDGMTSSDYVSVNVSKENYEDYKAKVFVTVQNTITDEDVIPLSKDVYHITTDKVKFTKGSDVLEYSLDDGATWNAVTTDEFSAAAGDTILVRKKGVGVANNPGYLKPSETKSLVVTTDNVGTPVYSIERVQFNSQTFKLTADTNAPNDTVFTVTINNRSISAKANQGKLTFDTTQCWTKSHKGGKSYPISIGIDERGRISGSVENSIEYWPKAECELKCPEEITVWNGKSETYQAPNYNVNYEDGTYEQKLNFVVKNEATDITSSVGAANWNLNDMLTYLCNTDHNGHSVEVTITLTPRPNGTPNTSLKCETKVTYHCLREKLVSSIQVLKYFDYYFVVAYDANDEPAGGVIQYEWQVSDNQNDWIATNDNQSVHRMSQDEIGKYLRCVITQTFEGDEKDPITSEAVRMTNIIAASDLRYNGVVQVGDNPVSDNISGTVLDMYGDIVDGLTFSWTNLSAGMVSSDEMTLTISKENFDDYEDSVFVNVQNVLSDDEVIPLSTDVRNIPANKAKFTDTSSDIECSFDNGTTWGAMPTDAFAAKLGDLILIRKKEIGTINQKGYIMASEPKTISVIKENIGLPVYTVNAQAQYDAAKDEITVTIDAPDGAPFDVILNNHEGDVHAYQGKLTFSAASFFTTNDECGIDYTIDVTADNAIITQSQATVSYWPKAKATLNSEKNVVIWTGNEKSSVPVPAYTLNYGNDKCDVTISYEVKYVTEMPVEVSTNGWTIDSMIDYIFDNAHTGQVVEVHFKAVPKKNNQLQNDLAVEWTMTYSHFQDKLINSAKIVKKYDSTSGYYFAITAYDSSDAETGGNLVYAWEISNSENGSYSAVSDSPTSMTHSLIQSEVGKYLQCKITQTFEGSSQTPVTTAPVKITSIIKSANLTYSEVVEEGTILDSSKLSKLSGEFVSIFGDTVTLEADNMNFSDEIRTVEYTDTDGAEYSMTLPNFLTEGLSYSMYVPVKITKDGYDVTHDVVFINVKSKLRNDDMPALTTDVWTVTEGKVKFDGDYYALEYKVNDAAEWKAALADEFSAVAGDVIHIRKKLWGVEGIVGCLKESDERTITVKLANIGTKTTTGISAEVKSMYLDMHVYNLDTNMNFIEFDVLLRNAAGLGDWHYYKYKYTWKVDGVPVQDTGYLYTDDSDRYIYLNKSKMISGEAYQISVLVEVYDWITKEMLFRDFIQKGVVVR